MLVLQSTSVEEPEASVGREEVMWVSPAARGRQRAPGCGRAPRPWSPSRLHAGTRTCRRPVHDSQQSMGTSLDTVSGAKMTMLM